MEKIKIAIEIAKFLIYVYGVVKALVIQAEELLPESGSGSSKFAMVKKSIIEAGAIVGFSESVTSYAESLIDKAIEDAVSTEINGDRQ